MSFRRGLFGIVTPAAHGHGDTAVLVGGKARHAPSARRHLHLRPSNRSTAFFMAILSLGMLMGSCAPSSQVQQPPAKIPGAGGVPLYSPVLYRGLDIFGPWQNGWDDEPWAFPTTAQLDYYKSKGLTNFRVPLLWENLQPRLFGPFDPTYLAAMDTFVANCAARGEYVSFTFINQGVYPGPDGNPIGSAQVPASAFYDLWTRMAQHYKDVPTVWAYDLINEPYRDPAWPTHAQGAIAALRAVDAAKPIIATPQDEGEGYQPITGFQGYSDPSHNLWYEAHVYFDADGSGDYEQSYDAAGAYPTIGVDRMKPFVNWCKAHNARCTVGEYGIPGGWTRGNPRTTYGSPTNDPRWDVALDTFLSYLDVNGISGNYWNAGPYGDINSVEPTNNGQDRPQMAILEKHLGR